jgi:ferredoxin
MAHEIRESCIRCGACLAECPVAAISAGKDQYFIDTDACDDHGACATVCPVNAIWPLGPEKTK